MQNPAEALRVLDLMNLMLVDAEGVCLLLSPELTAPQQSFQDAFGTRLPKDRARRQGTHGATS